MTGSSPLQGTGQPKYEHHLSSYLYPLCIPWQMVQKAAGHTEEGGGSPSFGSGGPAGGGVTASSRPSRLSARAAAAAAAAAAAGPVLDTPQLERGGRRAFTSPPTPRIGAPISTAPEQREALSVGPAPAPPEIYTPAQPRSLPDARPFGLLTVSGFT